jgi:YidC/Oxa1 family membrane protein insertase
MKNLDPNSFDMEKRIFLVLALSLALLMIIPYVYQQINPAPPAPVSQERPRPVGQPPAVTPAEIPPVVTYDDPPPLLPETRAEDQIVEIENENLVLRWNNRGVVLESAKLKGQGGAGREREALELIPQDLPATLPRPFQLRLEDEDLDRIINREAHSIEGFQTEGRIRAPAELTFSYRGSGVQVTRTVRVPARGYAMEMEIRVEAAGRPIPYSIFLGPGVGAEGYQLQGDFGNPLVVYESEGSVVRYSPKDLSKGPVLLDLPTKWVAMDAQYFAYGLLDPNAPKRLVLKKSDWIREDAEGNEYRVPLLTAQVGLPRDHSFTAFFVPKDYEVLGRIQADLGGLIDYGWFGWLVQPLLFGLKVVYGWVGNYGWAIIILTLFINLALFPVRYKQMVSMKKMADLQPKVRSIQDRYKRLKRDDPRRQEMNVEMMALYKEHGVNPLGGCLPLVVQMPFLFAFYRMLASSFELRGAPFILWIRDLSAPDPYYVTPIVMGATWMLQQAITPGGGGTDPMQRRMMMILPVVFTFFFLTASSGLALYFLFSNVFGMMFQLTLQKWSPSLSPGVPAPAKKR